jgi:hypothetical protein
MKAVLGLFLALLAPLAAAQSIVPTSGNGASIAPGAVANRVVFVVRDANGVPRPGMTVTFEATCTYRVRGDVGPYACVSVVPGEPLQVVSDSAGVVNSPLYQADGVGGGNAWIQATGNVDGAFVVVSFYWSVGAPKNPIALVSGSAQTVLVNQAAQPLTARVIDDLGRGVPGVPVLFQFNCPSASPCLLPTGPTTRVSNGSGLVDAGPRTANNVAGFMVVPVLVEGTNQTVTVFTITIIEPAPLGNLEDEDGGHGVHSHGRCADELLDHAHATAQRHPGADGSVHARHAAGVDRDRHRQLPCGRQGLLLAAASGRDARGLARLDRASDVAAARLHQSDRGLLGLRAHRWRRR